MRYYYKTKDNSAWWSLKTPDFANDSDKVAITEQEWNAHLEELKVNEE